MAGEIEEPFRFNFQADLLHSGSISFGRFESESLSWERRSSFSHNRYLEEVEKYSKPGSVTEKKAYFEAHFRRKAALLKQSSSECQEDGREFSTSENDDPQDLPETENGNESKYIQKCEEEKIETFWTENDNTSSHVSSCSNLGYEEGEVPECEREELGRFSLAYKDESTINTADHGVSVRCEENTRETVNDIVEPVNVASQATDLLLTSHSADKDDARLNSGPQQKLSTTVRPASEMKQTKSKQKVQCYASQVQRTISIEASIGSAKTRTRKSEGLLSKEKQKMSPRPASPIITHPGRKTSKSEESSMSNPKARLVPITKSIVKEYRSQKTVEAKSSVLDKSLPEARQTASRIKQTIGPSKPRINPGVNQVTAGFTFKSDQRAERRKESRQALFEKKAAEMTQSRKSLNFKSTPMPSFYKESAHSSDQNKVISTSIRTPNRPRTSSMTTRTNRLSSNSTASSSDTRPTSSSISLTNRNRPSESLRKSNVPEKKVHEKKKELSSPKQKDPEAIKGARGRDASRKDAKGVEIGPKMGYLAVGAAT